MARKDLGGFYALAEAGQAIEY